MARSNFFRIISFSTFSLNCVSRFLDQSLDAAVEKDITAISTPLDKVPLYKVPTAVEPITLLKSSHADSSSALLSFGTPETRNKNY